MATGLSRSTVCRYESGERSPTVGHMVWLCRALGISADELLGLDRAGNDELLSGLSEEDRRVVLAVIDTCRDNRTRERNNGDNSETRAIEAA
jgi:transcriptional regulator with XRE-family HTH domain